ncbi:phage portal protein [Paenibacillus glucanolyticus]|uniref:Phage portal protein n=1 Tax=Paenibacillus glucanolyticus TaxID=59843 RepID=A0A163HWM3_9BACL|nr:phage tail tube protein [Paenibacillus glucanolyticus]KZS45701.1 phage portal protein [Paenibacillus glucanolyticus]
MAFFREQDAISGKYAKAYATIDGRVLELFYAKSLESTIEKNKVDVPVLGKTNTPQRSAGWVGTGTMTVYYVSSVFRQLMRKYIQTGEDFWFDLMVTNEQPGSSTGKQTAMLIGCNVDSVVAAQFDATSDDMLEEEIPFTFHDYDIQDQFSEITGR